VVPAPTRPRSSLRRVAVGNVVALGMVSMFTDISSEMVASVLPAFLVLGLGLSVVQFGILDGLYTGATALTRLLGGFLADRFRQRKLVAGIGYGLSAMAKVGLLLVGSAPAAVGAILAVDRTGKGIRTAPRDALIASAVEPADLGQAFGLHRALDTFGAFLGPLLAFGILLLAGSPVDDPYDAVFVGSLAAAALGLLVLTLFVRNRSRVSLLDVPVVRARALPQLLHRPAFRRLCVVSVLLGLVTIGDGFVFLTLQQRDNLPVIAFPLLALGTSLVFLLLAVPLGRAADRIGRWPVIVAGYASLLVTYLLLAVGWSPVVLIVVLYGVFYAATDGVLMALAAPLIPPDLTTSGLALLQTGQALTYFCSSVLFGLGWHWFGSAAACLLAAAAAAVLLPLCALLLHPYRKDAE
jgi:MFS family permease